MATTVLDIHVKKKVCYWPVYFYLCIKIKTGKVTVEEAASFISKRCVKYVTKTRFK